MSLKNYRNLYEGERVFIIGNGPSLNHTPLEKLSDEFTIAMNRINLIYHETSWRPSFYVFCDNKPKWADSVVDTVNLGIPSFISTRNKSWLEARSDIIQDDNVEFYDYCKVPLSYRKGAITNKRIDNVWSEDITDKVYNFGGTNTVVAQICAYMGFEEMYFVGFDLWKSDKDHYLFTNDVDPTEINYPHDSTYKNINHIIKNYDKPIKNLINSFYYSRIYKNPKVPIGNKDQNHFDSQYHPEKVHKERLNRKFTRGHKIINLASEELGFDVYNATIGGHLEVYERRDFEKVADG